MSNDQCAIDQRMGKRDRMTLAGCLQGATGILPVHWRDASGTQPCNLFPVRPSGSRVIPGRRLVAWLWLASCLLCLAASPVSAQVTHGPPRIRNVYIPADQLEVVFGSTSKGVLMPRDKIMALWHEAQSHGASETVPPADAVLARAAYEARLADHELRVTGRIEIAKLRRGWQAVDLPFGGLAIESAQLGGGPARFGRHDDGTLFLLLEEKGRAELELEMSAPLASKGGDLATTLKLPPVPASEVSIRLDEGKQLRVGETALEPDGIDDGAQTFRVAVDHTGLVSLVVSDRFAGGNRAPLVFVTSRSIGHVEPAGLRWQVVLDLDVYARRTDSFELRLPGTVDVAEVDAPQLGAWTIREEADGTAAVALTFRKPFLGRRAVRLLGLAPVPLAEPWNVPTVKVLDVASHVGQVVVHSSPSLRVEVGALHGIRPERLSPPTADAAGDDMSTAGPTAPGASTPAGAPGGTGVSPVHGQDARGTLQPARRDPRADGPDAPRGSAPDSFPPATDDQPLAFAFWDEDFVLPLQVVPRRRQLQASVATLVEVDRAGLTLRSSVTVEPRHAPVFAVAMQLPRDWEVTSVLAVGQPVDWESVEPEGADPGAEAPRGESLRQTVRFDLVEPLRPGRSLEIALTAQRHPAGWLEQEEGFSALPLPELRLVGADEVEGTLRVQSPSDVELLVSDLSDDLEPVAADRSRGDSDRALGTALQYRYQDDARTSGRLQVRNVPAKVSVETLAFVRLDRGKLDVHYQLDLRIRHGKLRRIRFTLPAAVGEKIQIVPVDSDARVIEQRHAPMPGAGEGGAPLYLWHVVLDRPVTGELTLAVDFGQTFSAQGLAGEGAAPSGQGATGESVSAEAGAAVEVPVLAFEDVSRQSGMVALEAAGDQQIDYRPENLRELDPADVLKPKVYVPSQRIVAAYQYQRLPYRLTISATRHASESVLAAICEAAEITSVAGGPGRMRHQARFWLRSFNLQHLPVALPENADLWAVMLDSRPVEVRRERGTYIVPLPAGRADSPGDSRDLTLLYETDCPVSAAQGLWGRLRPQTIRQSAPEIAMTTLGTTWHVYPPRGTDLVSSGGDFQPADRLTRPTLVSRLAETVAHQSTTGLGWKLGGLVAVVVILGLFCLVTTGRGCAINLVEVFVVIGIIGVLIALLLPSVQCAREAARRSQCSNNLKQIGLALHNYHDVHKQFPPAAIGPSNVPRERQFSWMVAILPYLEQTALYDALRLDLPWDHPHNAALLQVAPGCLFCPSDPAASATAEGWPKTSYVAVTGADSTDGSGDVRGIIGPDRGLSIDEITDGTSNTLIVGEVTDGGPWFAGGSGTARRIDDWIRNKTWSHHPGGGNFVLADGSVRFISSNTDLQTLRHLATAQGLERIAEEDEYADVAAQARPARATQMPAPAPAVGEEEEKPALLTPRPAVPEEKPSPEGPPQPGVSRGERARLSLRVALETYGDRAVHFRREGGPGELVFGLQDRTSTRTLQWVLATAALLAAWITRRARGSRRAIAVVVGVAVPIAAAGLVPLAWTPLLDGLLLGALAAGCLWILLRIIAAIKTSVCLPMAGAAALGIGLLLATVAGAADETVAPGKPAASAEQARRPDLTLFIPYDPDTEQPLESTQVYLPHDEFLRLWKAAHPEEPDHVAPDVRAMVSHAEYSGRLDGDVARFDGRLLIHHFDDRWVRVALPLGEVALEQIQINGRPATLADTGSARVSDPAESTDRRSPALGSARVSDPAENTDRRSPARQETSGQPGGTVGRPATTSNGRPATTSNGRPATTSGGTVGRPATTSEGRPATTSNGRPATTPGPSADGVAPAIYLEEPGVHVVDVRFSVPVRRLGATGQMSVPVRAVPSGRLQFRLPAEGLDVQVGGCRGGWRRQAAGSDDRGGAGESAGELVSIPLGAAGELSIRWQPRRVEARTGQLVSVDQSLLVEVLDSGVHLDARFHYRIQQGSLGEVQLRVPPDVAVQSVDGAEVADWSIETDPATGPDAGAQRLVVALKTELTTGTYVDVRCFRRDRKVTGPLDVRGLEPLGVARETGRVAIGCSGHLRARVDETDRLVQIDRAGLDLPRELSDGCALLSAYRYTARPWRLQLGVERRRPRVEVSDRTAVVVTARRAALRSLLTARVTGAPIPSLGLRLPASLRVSQVRVPPGAEWFLDPDGDGQRLEVELNEPALGELSLAVSGSLVRDSSQAEFAVPGVTVEAVQAQRGQLAICVDDDLEAVLKEDGGARPVDPAALDGVLRPEGGRPVHYAFRYESPPEGLRLHLAPAPSRLNGDVITVVSVREGAVAYVSQVDFEIRQAGRSRFRIVTPPWLGDDVELRGEQIRQIRSQVSDSGRTWEIELQQPVRGTYRVQLMQTLPLPDDGTVEAAIIRPLDVERSRSHLVLENLTADEIASTTTRGVTPISIAEMPEGLTDNVRRQAVAAYRIADGEAVLVWQRRVREQETGLVASISLADLTTVVHADGRYQARAAYNIRNFTLQFLELELPSESRVWSVHVSGQPVRPAKIDRGGRPVTLLPLEKTSAGDFSSRVVVVYSGRLGEPLGGWTQVRPPAPRILSDVPVSRTLWTVLLPREYRVSLVKRESNLEKVAAAYQQEERKLSFLDEVRQMVQVAGTKGKSGARTKARYNLKQVTTALQTYREQSAQVDAINAAEVQEQAQQIEAEIRRLDELKTDARRADVDADFYFGQPQRPPEGDRGEVDLDRGLERLAELYALEDKAAPREERKKPEDRVGGRLEQPRGRLREQAAAQLERLQTMREEERVEGKETAPPPPPELPKGARAAEDISAPPAVVAEVGDQPPEGGQAAPVVPAAAAGRLSLDLDLPLVGTAYHFRKLHGKPGLVLRARHEDLGRFAGAVVWAGLSLALAAAAIYGLRRPHARALAARGWPWLAAVVGTAWLFLLPAGVLGLALLVVALSVLIARSRS